MLKRCLHVFSPMATVVCSQSASSGQGFLFLSFTVVSARISAARLVFATLGDMLNPRGLANSRRCVFLKCASVFERGCRKIEVRYPAFSASASAADGLFSRQPRVLSLPPVAGRESFRSQQAAPTAGAITNKRKRKETRPHTRFAVHPCIAAHTVYRCSPCEPRYGTRMIHWRLCVWCPLRDYRCRRRALRGKPPRDLEEGKSFFLLLLLALLPPGTQVFSESEPSLFGGPLRPLPTAATRPSPFTLPCWRSLFALLPPFFLFVAPLACAYVLVFGVPPSPPKRGGPQRVFQQASALCGSAAALGGKLPVESVGLACVRGGAAPLRSGFSAMRFPFPPLLSSSVYLFLSLFLLASCLPPGARARRPRVSAAPVCVCLGVRGRERAQRLCGFPSPLSFSPATPLFAHSVSATVGLLHAPLPCEVQGRESWLRSLRPVS